jgi:hypothetical protein
MQMNDWKRTPGPPLECRVAKLSPHADLYDERTDASKKGQRFEEHLDTGGAEGLSGLTDHAPHRADGLSGISYLLTSTSHLGRDSRRHH